MTHECRIFYTYQYGYKSKTWDMSFDVAQDNNVEEVELQGAEQGHRAISPHENITPKENEAKEDPRSKANLIQGVECSIASTERFIVRFVNTTDKTIDVVWLNFTGQQVRYQTLAPHTAWSVNTYKVCLHPFQISTCYIHFLIQN